MDIEQVDDCIDSAIELLDCLNHMRRYIKTGAGEFAEDLSGQFYILSDSMCDSIVSLKINIEENR